MKDESHPNRYVFKNDYIGMNPVTRVSTFPGISSFGLDFRVYPNITSHL